MIVIGGGDTGTDCVGTSLRHGCKNLVQFEILPEPPQERQADNPWPEWPKTLRTDYGLQEAIALYDHDPRHYEILTKRFVGDENGCVKELHTVQVEWVTDGNGKRPYPKEIPGTEKVWPAQLVLLAMGFLGPEKTLLEPLGVAQDERSNVKADTASTPPASPVFSPPATCGGQSLVVWAINEGRGAARECDRYLMGETHLP